MNSGCHDIVIMVIDLFDIVIKLGLIRLLCIVVVYDYF